MRQRTRIYDRVTADGRRRRFRSLFLCLFLLALILAFSLWIAVGILDSDGLITGFPWDEIRGGDVLQLCILFVFSFSSAMLYIVYYRRITEVSREAPRYLFAIAAVIILARLLFRF